MTPDEDRRIAVNPNVGGGYVFTVGESDRIEFRDVERQPAARLGQAVGRHRARLPVRHPGHRVPGLGATRAAASARSARPIAPES